MTTLKQTMNDFCKSGESLISDILDSELGELSISQLLAFKSLIQCTKAIRDAVNDFDNQTTSDNVETIGLCFDLCYYFDKVMGVENEAF